MNNRYRDLFKLFHRDERGQAMVITAILALVLFRCVMTSYNTGVAVSARIRGQTVADAAAYSGAIWQARFLNYCAYTRRAILANYAHIGLMNANIVNKMVVDNIMDCNDLWITAYQDRGLVTDLLEPLDFLRDIMVPVQGEHGDPKSGNFIPNLVDGQHVAEHMNVLLAESQEALHASIWPIEGIMDKIIEDSCIDGGEIVQAGLSHALGGNLIPSNGITNAFPLTGGLNANLLGGALGAPNLPLINALPKGLVYRDPDKTKIPLTEIRPLFERGHTKIGLPWHWGFGPIQGRPYSSIGIPPLNNPDYLKTVNVISTPLPIDDMGDTIVRASGQKGFFRTKEGFLGAILGVIGQYLWFYIRIQIGPFPLIIWIATPILGNGAKWQYDMRHKFVHVYEVRDEIKNSTDFHLLEPRVYCAVAMKFDKIPFFRPNPNDLTRHLNLLNEGGDFVCISSAKVYFQPLGANELTRRGAYPDTHFPFFGAKLATIKDGGRKKNSLFGPGQLLINSTRNPVDWLYNVSVVEQVGFSAFGYYPNY